jgi:hypothetical protein
MSSCSIDSTTRALSYSGTGDCIIRVTAAEVDYYLAGSKDFTFKSRETQTIALTAPSSVQAGSSVQLTTSGASGTGAQSFAVTSGAASCSITGDTLSALGVGSCQVTATVAEDSTYASVTSAAQTVTVTRAPQSIAMSGSTPASIVAGSSTPLAAVGYSGTGSRSFAIASGSTYCALSADSLIALAAGTCTVKVTIADDSVYASAASAPVSIEITRAPRALSVSAPASMSATQSTTLSTIGAVGTSPVIYSIVAGASSCQLSGQTLTATAAGTCSVQASQADDTFYAAAVSPAITVSISRATQVITWSPTTALTIPQSPVSPTPASALGSLTVAYTVIADTTTGCTVDGTTGQLSYTAPGTCTVRATALLTDVYEAGTADVTFTITKAASGIAWTSGSSTILATASSVLLPVATVDGGGALAYVVSSAGSTGCSITGIRTLVFTGAGACQVTASVPGDDSYLPGSIPRNFTIDRDVQPLTWFPSVTSATMADDTMAFDPALTAAGGGAITYTTAAGTAGCSVPDSSLPVLRFTAPGSCTVTATAAQSPIYDMATTSPRTFSIVLATPTMSWTPSTALEVLDSPAAPTVLASTTSDDTVTYAVVGGTSDCTVNSVNGVMSFTTLGTCQVAGSTVPTSRYTAGSVSATFVIGRSVRPIGLVATPASITVGETSRLSTTGVLSTGTLTLTVASGTGCSLSGSDLTASTQGTCAVTVNVAEDDTYAAATARVNVTVVAASAPPGPGPIDPGEPPKRSLDPIMAAADTPPGGVVVTLDGVGVSVRVVPHDDRRGIEIISDGWSVDVVSMGSDGRPNLLASDGTLPVNPDGFLSVSGRGFESMAQVRSYLLSGPVTLGALMTDRAGEFEGSLPAPVTVAPGAEALQINGFSPDREVRSITVGVTVMPSVTQHVMRAKLVFPEESTRLTKASTRKLRSMMTLLSLRDHSHTTITGVFFPPHGTHGRALAQARSKQVNRFLARMGLKDNVTISIKAVRAFDQSRGRRVVVRAYYTLPH